MQADCLCVARKALVQVVYFFGDLLHWEMLHFNWEYQGVKGQSSLILNGFGSWTEWQIHVRWRPHSGEGWTLGRAGMAVHIGHETTERGGYSEGPLAKIWEKLLHQVSLYRHGCVVCLLDWHCIISESKARKQQQIRNWNDLEIVCLVKMKKTNSWWCEDTSHQL